MAQSQAEALFQKDLIYRLWSAEVGEVYVPTNRVAPNLQLSGVADRDVVTTTGKRLTLVNPAYMTRMVHELGRRQSGVSGHITSLKPLRPGNVADAWEAVALRQFERGARRASEIVQFHGVRTLRFMGALVTEATCLPCHAAQGYRVGDVRGGISVAVSLEAPWVTTKLAHERTAAVGLVALWLCGTTGIGYGYRRARKRTTENDQAEEARLQSERRFRVISENTGDVIWTLNLASGRFTYVSPAVFRLRGFSPAEAMGQTMAETFTGESYQRVISEVVQTMAALSDRKETRKLWMGEVNQIRRDGSVVPTEVVATPLFDDQGEVAELVGVTRDITERRRAEASLKESEFWLKESQRVARIGSFVFDFKSNHWISSEVLDDIFGIDGTYPHTLKGWSDLVHPDQRQEMLNYFEQEVWGRQKPFARSYQIVRRKDGSERWVLGAGELVVEDNVVLKMVGTVQDITENRRLEDRLRQAQKMEAVGQLAGGVAHDFNNMLTVIRGHCSLLGEAEKKAGRPTESLGQIAEAAERASNLTRQLLAFSRRQVMQTNRLDLNQVIGNLLKMLQRLVGEHIVLHFEGQPALPLIEADSVMLEQVVMNLSVNARDAMPDGGRLTLRTQLVEVDAAMAAAHPDARSGRFVSLSASDSGSGMDASTLARLFEPFFTTKAVGKGTGLGLATVYGIVQQHRGWITVESKVATGSTFRIFLPVPETLATEPVVVPPRPPAVTGGQETILLVEDEASVRMMARLSLRRHGYRVLEAANGLEALVVWQKHAAEVDLVFTDMVMPEGMTGLELVGRLRALSPNLKVIVSSGYSLEICNRGAPTDAGLVFLPKPYEMQSLASAVRSCLDAR